MASRLIPIVALGAVLGAAALVHFYGGTGSDVDEAAASDERPAPTRASSAADDLEAATLGEHADVQAQPPAASAVPEDGPKSALHVFLEARGVPLERVDKALRELEAQPRDPTWSAGMEAQFQSALVQSTLTDAESYVECRRSLCVVVFVYPPETQPQQTQQPLPGIPIRAAVAEHQRLLSTLRLYGSGALAVRARNGALVQWHRFHRRCGPEWQCLE
jgi:hypothetical protein